MSKSFELGCDYRGNEFGAVYLDAGCFDGYLWDLDSNNERSELEIGGDIPCPQCNWKAHIKSQVDDFETDGYESVDHPMTTKMVKNVMSSLPSNHRRMAMRHWRKGRRVALREAFKEGL